MKDYSQYNTYTVDDFVTDREFRKWVFQPNEESSSFWQTFLMLYPQKQKTVHEACSLMLETQQYFDQYTLTTPEKQTLQAQIHENLPPSPTHFRYLNWKWAASIFFLVSIGMLSGWFFTQTLEQEIITHTDPSTKIWLPDSSWVILNANSSLTYPKEWNKNLPREVWLEGEGFFDIRQFPQNNRAFIVHTSALNIKVLGTTFNVKTLHKETRVVLKEGKIQLNFPETQRPDLIMKPGEIVSYSSDHQTLSKKLVNTDIYTSWKDGVLLLDHITLEEASELIEVNFNTILDIRDESLKSRKIHLAIPLQNQEVLFETLSTLFDVRRSPEGDTLRVYRR